MLENGISSAIILQKGTEILQYMAKQLPNTEDVDSEADFLSEQPPEDLDV